MLVLSRQRDESIIIGDEIRVTVTAIRGDKVRLGVTAPNHVEIHRHEIWKRINVQKETRRKRANAADSVERPRNSAGPNSPSDQRRQTAGG